MCKISHHLLRILRYRVRFHTDPIALKLYIRETRAKLARDNERSLMAVVFQDYSSNEPGIPERPYLPYPLAVESGVIDDPERLARPLEDSPGVVLASGSIPNARQAGLVDTGNDIIAFDLARIEVGNNSLQVYPASKDRVSSDGRITDEGAVIAGNDSGLLRIVALAIDRYKRPWQADKLASKNVSRCLGRISVFCTSPLDVTDHEITDIDLASGSILAKPRIRYF